MNNTSLLKSPLIWALLLLALYGAVLATWTFLETPRVAYVDSAVLLERYSGAVAARATLEQEVSGWQSNVETLRSEAEALGIRLTSEDLSRRAREAVSDSLNEKQRELARYGQAITEKAAEREREVLQPVYAELNARIADFSEERGVDVLLGTVAGGNILYGGDVVDLTEELLDYLNGTDA